MTLLLPLYVSIIALLKYYYMFNNDNTLHKVQHQHHHPGGISRVVDRFMTVMACERYGTRYPKLDIWGKNWECDYGDIKVQNGFRIQTRTLIDCHWFILMSSIASMQQTCSHSEGSSGFIGTYSGWVHDNQEQQSKFPGAQSTTGKTLLNHLHWTFLQRPSSLNFPSKAH